MLLKVNFTALPRPSLICYFQMLIWYLRRPKKCLSTAGATLTTFSLFKWDSLYKKLISHCKTELKEKRKGQRRKTLEN